MLICIVGDSQDLSSTYVSWLAQQRDFEVLILNEDALGIDWSFAYSDTDTKVGYIEKSGKCYPLTSCIGAFVRLNPEPGLPSNLSLPPEEAGTLIIERRHAIQHFLNSVPFTVANRSYAGRANGSKPYQMYLLSKAGFNIPKWIATNEESVVEEFLDSCQSGAIYKSCSGLRSQVRLLDDQLVERFRDGTSPVILQEYIKGYDVRIHVVNDHIFATKVVSYGVDYRFENQGNQFQETSTPDLIKNMCIDFAQTEQLTIAGFDFRVTDEGNWYCLEVNPVPTFLPYEMATGQAIGNALLDAFVTGN